MNSTSETTIGQTIARVVVTDKDLPPNNQSQLFISRGNEDGLFKIDGQGRVTVQVRIYIFKNLLNILSFQKSLENPENRTKTFNLTLLAFDGVHSTTSNMKIDVLPAPLHECPLEQTIVRVLESTTKDTVIQKASDSFGGIRMHYQLVTTEILPFSIDPKSGDVKTTEVLDREKRER